eukprot:6464807-Pyramimonas_sp.AAC.1
MRRTSRCLPGPPGGSLQARASATPPLRALPVGLTKRAAGRASRHLTRPPGESSCARASATPPPWASL